MKLVWVSRHELTPQNHQILKQAFGDDYEVIQFKETVKDVRELKRFADDVGGDGYVVVLPPHLIMELMKIDQRPVYRFVVERKVLESGDVEIKPIGLEQILEVKVVTKRIV